MKFDKYFKGLYNPEQANFMMTANGCATCPGYWVGVGGSEDPGQIPGPRYDEDTTSNRLITVSQVELYAKKNC